MKYNTVTPLVLVCITIVVVVFIIISENTDNQEFNDISNAIQYNSNNNAASDVLEMHSDQTLASGADYAEYAVYYAVLLYEDKGKDYLFENLNWKRADGTTQYVFVIDPDTQKIVGHPNKFLIGKQSQSLIHSVQPYEQIMQDLDVKHALWVSYNFTNPDTGQMEPKTSWMRMYDGLIFGSGYHDD